ncbi:MAG TPA: pitrilysin family protein [Candidatus Saccharimonadaceae bacterium]|jgi:predicted Zn-dependent peptidase|nr:pitrilysin family protein [Candidatus Saccharimonadaceae bacterium]
MSENTFRKSVLPSGVTLLSERMAERRSIAVGVWVRNGARDEPADLLGISHFIEHMMFKGTERRDARAIAQSLESLGGHLDAFTAREQVCYYARALSEHAPDVIDVLFDLLCHSRFAETEVEREKSVVREEIFSCEDNPDDKVNELLAGQIWSGHALGRPILGTADTVTGLSPRALRRYFASRYRAAQLVVSAAGAIDHDALAALIEAHVVAPEGDALPLSDAPPAFAPSVHHEVRADLQQLYLALGTRGLSYQDVDRYPLVVLNALLGGGMSSRLFQSVREEAGLAYSVYSAPDFHRDAGMLSIQLGVSPERGREALALVREELIRLCADGVSEEEVESGRSQLKGSVVMGQESVSNRMSHLAQEEIYRGRYVAPDEQVARVLRVTRDQVMDVARRLLRPERFALTALGPAPGGALGETDWPLERASQSAA